MNAVCKVILVILMLSIVNGESPSIGTELATIVQDMFNTSRHTIDVCILFDNPHTNWTDLVEDFCRQLASSYFVVVRTDKLLLTSKQCAFYLIYMDARSETFEKFAWKLYIAKAWNRFARIVFVTGEYEINASIVQHDSNFYASVVINLGISNSVHLILFGREKVFKMSSYNIFQKKMYSVPRSSLATLLKINFLRNVLKNEFVSIGYNYPPFMFVVNGTTIGSNVKVLETFTTFINATLRIILVSVVDYDSLEYMKGAFMKHSLSVVFNFHIESYITEVLPGHGLSSFCLLIPERPIGPFFEHLPYPFQTQLWILILLILFALLVIGYKLPRLYPRCIINQLLFGATVDEYVMTRTERFTLFSLTVVLFMLSEAYLAKILQFMVTNKYEPHITTMEEFMATNQSIYTTSSSARRYLSSSYPQYAQYIHFEQSLLNDPDGVLKTVTYVSCISGQLIVNSLCNTDPHTGISRVYTMEKPVSTMPMSHIISRMQPFAQKFKQVYDRLQEAGFLDYWQHQITTFLNPNTESPGDGILTFSDLISLWFILAYGWGISAAILLLEVAYSKRHTFIEKFRNSSKK